MVSKSEKLWLLIRANYCCEYCHRHIHEESYQVDHVFPESRGGKTIRINLSISCERCNRNKGDNVEWKDPFTGILSPIFNPRSMRWEEHFIFGQSPLGQEIMGRSSIGRATASLLFRHTPQYIPGRDLQWEKLRDLQQNKSLYQFGNHLRFLRLQNDFGTLHNILSGSLPKISATESERQSFEFAKTYLLIEVYFTRSRNLSEINRGIAIGQQLLRGSMLSSCQTREIHNLMSILYQQRATIHYLKGRLAQASKDQASSCYYYSHNLDISGRLTRLHANPSTLLPALRLQSLNAKYAAVEVSEETIKHLTATIKDISPFEATQYFSYLIDVVMSSRQPSVKMLEVIYEEVTTLLLTQGYGTSVDLAKLITLRRRWWALHLFLGLPDWQDTLIGDMDLWRKIFMFNEIREVKCMLHKSRIHFDAKKNDDIQYILRS